MLYKYNKEVVPTMSVLKLEAVMRLKQMLMLPTNCTNIYITYMV
jgi:hypothetical protein